MSTLHLDKLLDPASIALVGASARVGSPGLALSRNLLAGDYRGVVHLVNPRYKEVLGQVCHKHLRALEEAPDLVLIRVPERLLRRTLVQCARVGSRVAIVMSGAPSSRALHRHARRLGLRILGPWCAGLIRPHLGLNATASTSRAEPGSLAVVSQSASLGAALLDWAESSGVGFSALLSTGGDTDIRLADLLDLLAEDRHTRSIVVYLDRVAGSRGFLSALSATARLKPVVLMRSTQDGAPCCDALTRTGQVFTSDAVFEAALKRAGVVRIRTFSNLFAASRMLASRARTNGRRLAVISNGAAPAMLACERLETKGFRSPRLDDARHAALVLALERKGGRGFTGRNPVVLRDVADLGAQYRAAIGELHDPREFDAVLVIFAPDSVNDPDAIARSVIESLPSRIPLLACWMGDASVASARETFAEAGLASFRTPEAATDAFDFLHRYHTSQQQLLQLPNPVSRHTRADIEGARTLVDEALDAGVRVLDPDRVRHLMRLFDIDVLPSRHARSMDEAMAIADEVGWPVAMKLVSPNLSYKASVLPTRLGLDDEASVRAAWSDIERTLARQRPDARFDGVVVERMHAGGNRRELAASLSRDPTFGPVIRLGLGDDLTALGSTSAVQLPPLNNFLIDDMLASRDIAVHLGAFRRKAAIDPAPVAHVLRRLSELACELPDVFSLDINPLLVGADGALAMDVQVVLERGHAPASDASSFAARQEDRSVRRSTRRPARRPNSRYGHLAIHPYPWQWVRETTLKGEREVTLRPIRPEDGQGLGDLVRGMSAESRYFRFMHAINELSPQMVAQFTKLDYDRQMAFVAADGEALVGVSRYTMDGQKREGEFAISVADDWQGLGLASALMRLLVEHATAQGLAQLRGDVLRSNRAMQGLMNALGFVTRNDPEDRDVVSCTLALPVPAQTNDAIPSGTIDRPERDDPPS